MFETLSDSKLLIDCKEAVRAEKQSTLRVIEYLSEVDRRKIYLGEGYSSLFDFCVRFLNYSEGESYRRIQACRLSMRVEEVKPLLEEGTLSLTAMSVLSPHLTKENAKEILPQVTRKSVREVEQVIAQHFPESKRKEEILKIEMDEELKNLLEEAKLLASEPRDKEVLKTVLRNYLREKKQRNTTPKRHTRYVPRKLAEEIKKESNYQCEYKSPTGKRCTTRAYLEIDHIRPFAKGGSSQDKTNLRCLCRSHNQYLAKKDFPKNQLRPATGATTAPVSRAG